MDLVSVITPVYNAEDYLAGTIQSVKDQQYPHWEMWLINDCSTDKSKDIIESFMLKDKRINYLELDTNSGAAAARNAGIKEAGGTYIAFLDSDDRWFPDKLARQIEYMKTNNSQFSFTDYMILDTQSGKEIPFHSPKDHVTYRDEIRFNYLATSTVVFNQDTLGKIYMPDFRNRQDWALWILLLRKAESADRVAEKLCLYYRRSDSISGNKIRLVKYHWLIYKEFLEFSRMKSLFMLIRNVWMHIQNMRNKQ